MFLFEHVHVAALFDVGSDPWQQVSSREVRVRACRGGGGTSEDVVWWGK